jgi:hypothetical protein
MPRLCCKISGNHRIWGLGSVQQILLAVVRSNFATEPIAFPLFLDIVVTPPVYALTWVGSIFQNIRFASCMLYYNVIPIAPLASARSRNSPMEQWNNEAWHICDNRV